MSVRRSAGKVAALLMAVLLGLYLVASLVLAVGFLSTGEPVGVAMGGALVALPILGGWALWRELRFGWQSERLVKRLDAEGGLLELPAAANGPEARALADAMFGTLQADVVSAPERWQGWLRLSLGYDAAGDRKRARQAARRAIELARSAEHSSV